MKKNSNTADTEYYNRIIGSNIYYERKKHNLTLDELAETLCTDRNFLELVEKGEAEADIENLVKLAGIFNLSLDELITADIQKTGDKEDTGTEKDMKYPVKLSRLAELIKSMKDSELDYLIANTVALIRLMRYMEKNAGNNIED